ncbi:hypothetical protein BAUCODRAFT_29465 [Baudoinia panamericana UAMH 10762]|uniref:Methyltransferase domain-containing protein n=1 Tax=Baudoinia panamericana (strain UAMH 10762) TaxID=717646 RepID=M2NQ06_BAUPA|nr:uncharacterized protein BAUCODRAFT_29465 [Baudoinia panamericana UAMH 10762]EMD01081.1 hypothetical protein BAUCODRAFT_29465 [Baudoinia panamericana UAMH 10762]
MEGKNTQSGYLLGRSSWESCRLNLQHYLFKEDFGYLLHPSVNTTEKSLIADVGCGTAIWPIQLAKTLPPSVEIHGFDIDLKQAPPPQWLPDNLKLDTLDALAEIPEHLRGKYDVVHLRLFVFVVENDDPMPLIRNMMTMLKPGGYLQWEEYDREGSILKTAIAGQSVQCMVAAMMFPTTLSAASRSQKLSAGWPSRLGQHLQEGGLQLVADEKKVVPDEYLAYQQDVNMVSLEEVSRGWAEEDVARFGDIFQAAEKERANARKGIAFTLRRRLCVAKKPM